MVRRFTLSLRPLVLTVAGLFALPVLMGLGAKWSARTEIEQLHSANQMLEVENDSYRAATGTLTTQIQSLQDVITDLGARSALDAATSRAIAKLPAVVRSRAAGGAKLPAPATANGFVGASLSSPEDTFGILRDLLEGLESRLRNVRKDVERRESLAAATPSIWPVHGWLSAGFGERKDPFDGENAFHQGLDISADRGQPVYVTADGKIESASYSGAYGNLIVVDHGFGLRTRYGHLSAFKVRAGDPVKRGDVIGLVGSTGRATGAHLHYEVQANGALLNPLQLLVQGASHP